VRADVANGVNATAALRKADLDVAQDDDLEQALGYFAELANRHAADSQSRGHKFQNFAGLVL
jgi:hypothetical protein